MEPSRGYVIDANIVFGALSARGFSFELIKLLSDKGICLYSPQYIREELDEKKARLAQYSGLDAEEIDLLLKVLFKQITVIPKQDYAAFIPDAVKLLQDHPEDISYFALALFLNIPLWSNEKRLHKQSKVKMIPTHELKKQFGFE